MPENEQIQEMARTICGLNTDEGCFCDGGYCNYKCLAYEKAEALYSKGYHKASEVAREIIKSLIDFVDRKERLHPTFLNCSWCVDSDDITDFISEIKKKYTEEQNNEL